MTTGSPHPQRLVGWFVLAATLAACGGVTPATTPRGAEEVACPAPGQRPRLDAFTTGPTDLPYDGPAIVEQAFGGLTLAFTPAATGTGGAPPLPVHMTFIGLCPAPVFPVGARVWLSKGAETFRPTGLGFRGPWWFAVRDKQDGRLLFGAGDEPPAGAFAPFSFDNSQMTRSEAYDDHCGIGTAVYSSIDVHGDETVTINDDETQTVRAGGADYDVSITNRDITTTSIGCGDYYPPDGFGVTVKAKDLASLVATLEVGDPIACQYPDPDADAAGVSRSVFVSVYDVLEGEGRSATSLQYDGPVTYWKRNTLEPSRDCFQFNQPVELPSGARPVVELCSAPGLLRQPAAGQTFWLTTTWIELGHRFAVLRGPNRGPLLLAAVDAYVPFDAPLIAGLESALGLHAEARPSCLYADNPVPGMPPYPLWEVAFGTTPEVVVKVGSHGTVPIFGKSSDVWTSISGRWVFLSFTAR